MTHGRLTFLPSARSLGSSLNSSTILPEAAIIASRSLMPLPSCLEAMSSSSPLHRYYSTASVSVRVCMLSMQAFTAGVHSACVTGIEASKSL